MPKAIARSKTRKAVAKRFKINGARQSVAQRTRRGRHLLSSKRAKRKRRLVKQRWWTYGCSAHQGEFLPFG